MQNQITIDCLSEVLLGLHLNAEGLANYVKKNAVISLFKESKLLSGTASEVTSMKKKHIVDEVRNNGLALSARYNNDIEAICKALKEIGRTTGRMVFNHPPHRLVPQARA